MKVTLDNELMEEIDKLAGTWAEAITGELVQTRLAQESTDSQPTPWESMAGNNFARKITSGVLDLVRLASERQKAARTAEPVAVLPEVVP